MGDIWERYAYWREVGGASHIDGDCNSTARAIFHWLGCVASVAACLAPSSVVPNRHSFDGNTSADEVLRRAGLWTDREGTT